MVDPRLFFQLGTPTEGPSGVCVHLTQKSLTKSSDQRRAHSRNACSLFTYVALAFEGATCARVVETHRVKRGHELGIVFVVHDVGHAAVAEDDLGARQALLVHRLAQRLDVPGTQRERARAQRSKVSGVESRTSQREREQGRESARSKVSGVERLDVPGTHTERERARVQRSKVSGVESAIDLDCRLQAPPSVSRVREHQRGCGGWVGVSRWVGRRQPLDTPQPTKNKPPHAPTACAATYSGVPQGLSFQSPSQSTSMPWWSRAHLSQFTWYVTWSGP